MSGLHYIPPLSVQLGSGEADPPDQTAMESLFPCDVLTVAAPAAGTQTSSLASSVGQH